MRAGSDRQRGVLSPTGARYVLLIVTLALAGAFVGQVIHNLVLGPSWASAVVKCGDRGSVLFPDSAFEQAKYLSRCTGPVQSRQAEVSLLGSVAVLLLGLAGLWVLPRRLLRRAGPLKAVPTRWQERADRIAAEMGDGVRRAWSGGARVPTVSRHFPQAGGTSERSPRAAAGPGVMT